jgi:hypothetical protein
VRRSENNRVVGEFFPVTATPCDLRVTTEFQQQRAISSKCQVLDSASWVTRPVNKGPLDDLGQEIDISQP